VHWAGLAGPMRDRGRVPGKRRTPPVLPVTCDVLRPIAGKRRTAADDRHWCDVFLARLATSQSGVVGRKQLLALGFTGDEVDYRVEARRLLPVHRGVYAVGHKALSDRGRCVAALLATGPGAALSHRTALALHRLIPSMPQLIEVTLTTRRPRQRAGIKVHHAANVETTIKDGLPVTTVAQTLKDVPDRRATAEALYRGLIDRSQTEVEPTQSELEDALLPALAKAGIPKPLTQHRLGPYRADFFWPDHNLVVETDGWQKHGHRAAFEEDRARDAHLQAAGYRVLRFTWKQVIEQTLVVVVRIAQCTPHHALATPPAGG
jgi:very-short-patch-repair endonuclease